jgi:RNA polymerase sigma factor (sigma-70 family)
MTQPSSRFAAWLFTIASHVAVDRSRKRRPETFSGDAPPEVLDPSEPVPDVVLRRLAVYACLEKLTAQERYVIDNWEAALGTKSLTEMAEDLGVSVPRVHAIKTSALLKLRACLEDKGCSPG